MLYEEQHLVDQCLVTRWWHEVTAFIAIYPNRNRINYFLFPPEVNYRFDIQPRERVFLISWSVRMEILRLDWAAAQTIAEREFATSPVDRVGACASAGAQRPTTCTIIASWFHWVAGNLLPPLVIASLSVPDEFKCPPGLHLSPGKVEAEKRWFITSK